MLLNTNVPQHRTEISSNFLMKGTQGFRKKARDIKCKPFGLGPQKGTRGRRSLASNSQGYLPHGIYHVCILFLRKATLQIMATIDHFKCLVSQAKYWRQLYTKTLIALPMNVVFAMKINGDLLKENLPKDS